MSNTFNFKKLDRVTLNEHSVIIAEPISSSGNKEVYKVIFNLEDKTQNILKVLYGDDIEAHHTIDFYMNDSNDNFVEIIDYHKEGNKTFLLLKYYEKHTLHEEAVYYTDAQRNHYIKSILEIGCYLHQKNYLHADIKPENFFLDGEHVRLGDLESLVKLDNLQTDAVPALCGTKGFKYSTEPSYTLKDEMFAYVASIYYIEVGEYLISPDDLKALNLPSAPTEQNIHSIHTIARENIDFITRDGLKELLLHTLDQIETSQPIDCCTLFKSYKALAPMHVPEAEPAQVSKKPQIPTLPSSSTLLKRMRNYALIVIGALVFSMGAVKLFSPTDVSASNSAPTCQKAWLIEHGGANIIKTHSKENDERYYTLNEDGSFHQITGTDALTLINVKVIEGSDISCTNGRLPLKK